MIDLASLILGLIAGLGFGAIGMWALNRAHGADLRRLRGAHEASSRSRRIREASAVFESEFPGGVERFRQLETRAMLAKMKGPRS